MKEPRNPSPYFYEPFEQQGAQDRYRERARDVYEQGPPREHVVEGAHAGGGPLDHEARASPQGYAREHQAQVPDLGPERPGIEHAAGEEIRRADVLDGHPDHGDGRPRDGLAQLGKEPRQLVGLVQEHH